MSTRAMVYVVESLPLRLISVISSGCGEMLRSGVIEEDIQFVDKCKQITIIQRRGDTSSGHLSSDSPGWIPYSMSSNAVARSQTISTLREYNDC